MLRNIPWWWLLLLVLAVLTRTAGLGERVMSHDESIHVLTAWNTLQGDPYIHDPVYHGPLLYFLNRAVFRLGGSGDFAGRLVPALFGIFLVMAPALFRRELGERGAVIASVLLLVSPAITFYSRYNRHDVLAAVFALLLFRWLWHLQQRRGFPVFAIAACFAALFLTKEVSYIYGTLFGAGLGLVGLAQWKWGSAASLFHAWRGPLALLLLIAGLLIPFAVSAMGYDPLDFSPEGLYYIMPLFIMVCVICGGLGVLFFGKRWLGAYLLFYFILLVFYTWFGRNPGGAYTGLFGSLGYWLSQHEVARGGQPWYFYGLIILLYEGPLLILVAAAFSGLIRAYKEALPWMLLFWLGGSILIYSWAGEKMPWLVMHICLPAILFCGWGLGRWPRRWSFPVLGIAVILSSLLSLRVNVMQVDHPNELMQYAGGHRDVKRMLDWMDAVEHQQEKPLRVACGTDLAWPHSWYFRQREGFAWSTPDFQNLDLIKNSDVVLVLDSEWEDVETRVVEAWGGPVNVVVTRMGMTHWPDQRYRKPLSLHRQDLREGRTQFRDGWNLLLHGQPYDPAEEWMTQTTFVMAVRKAVAEKSDGSLPFTAP